MLITGLVQGATAQADSTTLTPQQRNLVSVAATTAKGDLPKLAVQLNKALDAGLTVNQLKEAIVHLYAYCGFPRSIRGLQTLMTVLEDRKAKGITDKWGNPASPITDNRSKYDRGRDILAKLSGTSASSPKAAYAVFSPEIEVFLKEHLFADLFERDVLNYTERELVTISVLSSIGGVEPMLKSHLGICLHIGLTPMQLQDFVKVIAGTIGEEDAKATEEVLTALTNTPQTK
ncbi:alkylhydroperoxidase/carboxymuconolactone decarboxylase family protein YurZ [Chitinophaga skermanii]|uniref:Alkylhydroperoxidase/carboxymuconolactone decarboxylase family protein YurZ n=2 Tax=Chitinophaga skermanii TaxID=331697 RepID=A0A327QNB6_9BACT|nr:alkylhydroperoxidase/carboxymuconolactone decarboxylase family protein YurZ [Chitinophaga skermanii]